MAVFEIGFGLLLAIHCPRSAFREFRSGVAHGRHGEYRRANQAIRFWVVVTVTLAAGLMGALFAVFGILQLVLVW
jgi:hypothetical protein